MKFSKDDIQNELMHVERNLDFSEDCPPDFKQFLFAAQYVKLYDEVLMLTNKGEEMIGFELDGLDLDDDAPISMYKRYTVNDDEF